MRSHTTRLLRSAAFGTMLFVVGCAASLTAAEETMSSLLSDAQAVETGLSSKLTMTESKDVTAVLSGLQAVLTAAESNSGSAEATGAAALDAAVKQIVLDFPNNAVIQKDGPAAEVVIGAVSATSSEALISQAYAAAGALVIDYLSTATSSAGAASTSDVAGKIVDARKQIATLQTGS